MHLSIDTPAHDVLRSDSTIQTLYNDWVAQNKSRIYSKMRKHQGQMNETGSDSLAKTAPPIVSKPTSISTGQNNPFVSASLKNVVSGRKDLPSRQPNATISNANITPPNPGIFSATESMYATGMVAIEKDIMKHVCDRFLTGSPPYSTDTQQCYNLKGPVPSACCAHITENDNRVSRKMYLPISAPCPDQILKCNRSTSYNQNVQNNIASALDVGSVNVVMVGGNDGVPASGVPVTACVSGSATTPDKIANGRRTDCKFRNTIHMDSRIPVKAMVTIPILEDLLFGDSRITSSAAFSVGVDIGSTYAAAVDKFQYYGSVRVGENLTLTPSFFKKMPFVVSMSCPELNISDVVTGFSGSRNHEKFGPNHTIKLVEVMAKLTPFVTKCCEAEMGLNHDTVEDLVEDDDMPVATSTSIDHCFADNPRCGVSAYVGSHTFSLSTSILNTYTVPGQSDLRTTPFPIEKKILVHVAALFSGAVVDTRND
jgi:hypothetical protein